MMLSPQTSRRPQLGRAIPIRPIDHSHAWERAADPFRHPARARCPRHVRGRGSRSLGPTGAAPAARPRGPRRDGVPNGAARRLIDPSLAATHPARPKRDPDDCSPTAQLERRDVAAASSTSRPRGVVIQRPPTLLRQHHRVRGTGLFADPLSPDVAAPCQVGHRLAHRPSDDPKHVHRLRGQGPNLLTITKPK